MDYVKEYSLEHIYTITELDSCNLFIISFKIPRKLLNSKTNKLNMFASRWFRSNKIKYEYIYARKKNQCWSNIENKYIWKTHYRVVGIMLQNDIDMMAYKLMWGLK